MFVCGNRERALLRRKLQRLPGSGGGRWTLFDRSLSRLQQAGIAASLLVDQRWSSSLQSKNGNVCGAKSRDFVGNALIRTCRWTPDRNHAGAIRGPSKSAESDRGGVNDRGGRQSANEAYCGLSTWRAARAALVRVSTPILANRLLACFFTVLMEESRIIAISGFVFPSVIQ